MVKVFFLLTVLLFTGCAGTQQTKPPSAEYTKWNTALADAKVAAHAFLDHHHLTDEDSFLARASTRSWNVTRSYRTELALLPANAPNPTSLAELAETPRLVVVCGNGSVSSFLQYYKYVKKPVSPSAMIYNGEVQKISDTEAAVQVWYSTDGKTELLNPQTLAIPVSGMTLDRSTGRLTNTPKLRYELIHDVLLRGATGMVFIDPIAKADGQWWGELVFHTADFRKAFSDHCY